VAGLRIVWVAVRDRRLNAFATMMLVIFGIGLILSFVSGDAREATAEAASQAE
jgi:hypothetical protein